MSIDLRGQSRGKGQSRSIRREFRSWEVVIDKIDQEKVFHLNGFVNFKV